MQQADHKPDVLTAALHHHEAYTRVINYNNVTSELRNSSKSCSYVYSLRWLSRERCKSEV